MVSKIAATSELVKSRTRIDHLALQIVRLLNERAQGALAIGAAKRSRCLPIHCPERETAVLRNVLQASKGALTTEHLIGIYRQVIRSMQLLQSTSPDEPEND